LSKILKIQKYLTFVILDSSMLLRYCCL